MPLAKALQKDAVDISAQFTLLTLLFSQVGNSFSRPFILFLAALGLIIPGWYRQPLLWYGLFFFTAFRVMYEWPMADNHSYLLALWCLALPLSLSSQSAKRVLAGNARILIGLVFLLASYQKISSPDYLDGTFFRLLFLADNRFEDFAVLLGNISYQQIDHARELLDAHQFSVRSVTADIVPLSIEFHLLVIISTWWNLLDQIAVACCFLCPANSKLYQIRDFFLLVFSMTTYAVAPVPGFGWLLISMALAQCEPVNRVRIAYCAVFFLILFYYEVPWAEILVEVLGLG